VLGVGLAATLAAAGRGVTPREFFAGRLGVMYMPDDVSTLGASRVGAGFGGLSAASAVGIMLDLARGGLAGLGVELCGPTAGYVSVPTWAAGLGSPQAISVGGGAVRVAVTGSVTAAVRLEVSFPCESGKTYRLAGQFNSNFGAAIVSPVNLVFPGGVSSVSLLAGATPSSMLFHATASGTGVIRIYPRASTGPSQVSGDWIEFSALSVREFPGCHQVAQTADANRPLLEAFAGSGPLALRGNGSSTAMSSIGTLDLTGTDEVTLIAAVRSLADAATGIIAELSANWSIAVGAFSIYRHSSNVYFGTSIGSSSGTSAQTAAVVQPDSALLVLRGKISLPRLGIARNRGAEAVNTSTQGGGSYGDHQLHLLARAAASLRFNGQLGRLLVAGGALTAEELLIATALVATKYSL
jgi:hypothetical protein